jgi:short-subunit dehydrogenase
VSKSALLTLKNCLAAEWAKYGIRVNSISPGYMDTILNEGDGIAEARKLWASRNPLGRMGTPSELTGAVVLLSSSASSYINGIVPDFQLRLKRSIFPKSSTVADVKPAQEPISWWMEDRYSFEKVSTFVCWLLVLGYWWIA